MEIFIEDIPPEGLAVEATEADAWLTAILQETEGETYAAGERARLQVSIGRIDGNISLDGTLEFRLHPTCDRCLAVFDEEGRLPFHTVLAPLYEGKRQMEQEEGMETELVREDLNFGYYEGDSFDLGEIVREQALLAHPMKHLCREDCRGLCQRCGKDLNQGPCGCIEDRAEPRWAVLKDVKVRKT